MRYGSFQELYQAYSASVPNNLCVGRTSFRKILGAVTVKGSYNQGLSYFYVNFVNMIKLLLEMFDRMQSIVRQHVVEDATKEEIKTWLDKARNNTKRSREYFTHHYYGEIQKITPDS
jgi:hypothetical protein